MTGGPGGVTLSISEATGETQADPGKLWGLWETAGDFDKTPICQKGRPSFPGIRCEHELESGERARSISTAFRDPSMMLRVGV